MEATQAEPGLRLIREREEPLMKTVIVGANHGGIAAANTLLDHYPDHRVVMIDQNTNISYLGCGTALWVGRQIDSYQDLFYTKKEDFEKKGASVHMETTVRKIDFERKIVFCEKTSYCSGFARSESGTYQLFEAVSGRSECRPLNWPHGCATCSRDRSGVYWR